MVKKIIIVLVVFGFAWSLPAGRARISRALSPALGLLGPVGYRMQEPMRKYRAETDVKFLVDQLQMHRTEGRQVPNSDRAFTDWMSSRKGAGEKGRDPWGNLYWLKRGEGAVTVGSSGPDGERNTPDDIHRSGAL